MPLGTPAPPNKRKKLSKIITDLSHILQDEYDSEPEASEFDLGTKIRTPRDIMLEELSLLKNRGSKMFKMRQKRVEKFIWENNPDIFCSESMDNLQKLVPGLGGQVLDGCHMGSKTVGGGMDDPTNKTIAKTYLSPWEKAMKGDESLTSTMKSKMAGPCAPCDLIMYKCFNRSAMPFGGYEKANMLMKFQLPSKPKVEMEPVMVYQHEIGCRPDFNRTPIGWLGSGEPNSIHMETDTVPFDGETDDLFSKEHEAGLERDLQLETGLLPGFKRDPADFEWSFWSEWTRRSLLWTLTGHGLLSISTGVFVPKLRVAALLVYGLLAAGAMLGVKGVCVLLLHLGLSFTVAQLRRPALCWACSLLSLSTLHVPPLQKMQRGWYDTEEEYYLLLFSVAVCGLRMVSFSLEHCWRPLEPGGIVQLFWLLSYSFYHPLFYNGPIITYKDYTQQMRRSAGERFAADAALRHVALRAGRIALWWLTAECMIHTMYMHSIQANETYLDSLPPWALGGLALALVQFFYIKYLVLFGVPSALAALDKLHFDEGLYRWLIRYIYVPLGGSRRGPAYKALSTGLAFGFVCLWHGGHDYLQYWALMNWAGVLVENGLQSLLASSFVSSFVGRHLSVATRRRCAALLFAFSTAMLILSNLVFLGGAHVGRIFWKRVFVQGWSTIAPPMLAFLYCFAQIGLEWAP
ncbi:hypothetical protein NHX12_023009 [Muraenolepis orangiensis]|uniref:Uncharacterized protein n=1 Tax=Muraenolepis orangiensis TaxID=630683 RepID=A0A9Q0EPF2_9TELE|nr:hypothetical protein NHX12_023009 [Muraenolepis orangiensis]